MAPRKDKRSFSENYRKPPVEYQFKKGTSGNYDGRRPKKKAEPGFDGLGGGIADRLAAITLSEATRLVTVREGDKKSEMPAIQALLRTMFRAVAQGDTRVGIHLMNFIARAESQRTNSAMQILSHAAGYKEKYGPIFEQFEREGLDPPEIYPHPDDIIINETTGEVSIDGPTSKDHAVARTAVREHAYQSLRRYFEVEAALEKEPKNQTLRRELKKLKPYRDFLMQEADRNTRHKALQAARRVLKKPESDDDTSDQ